MSLLEATRGITSEPEQPENTMMQHELSLGGYATAGAVVRPEPSSPAVPYITTEHHELLIRYGRGDISLSHEDIARLHAFERASQYRMGSLA